MTTFIFYCLFMFFAFYVTNHSPLLEEQREYWLCRMPYWMCYSATCAFCFTFWISIGLGFFGLVPDILAFTAPPVVLFLNLIFERLKNDNKTES